MKLRIALCGYDDMSIPEGWISLNWKTNGGYAKTGNGQGKINRHRETIIFSPGCLNPEEAPNTKQNDIDDW